VPHSNRKFGEVREDGYRFVSMRYDRLKKDGTYGEDWRSPKVLKNICKTVKNRKKESMILLAN